MHNNLCILWLNYMDYCLSFKFQVDGSAHAELVLPEWIEVLRTDISRYQKWTLWVCHLLHSRLKRGWNLHFCAYFICGSPAWLVSQICRASPGTNYGRSNMYQEILQPPTPSPSLQLKKNAELTVNAFALRCLAEKTVSLLPNKLLYQMDSIVFLLPKWQHKFPFKYHRG